MRKWLTVLALLLLSACRVDREPMNAAHAERVSAIHREVDGEIAADHRRWTALRKKVLLRRKDLIPVADGTASSPAHPVVEDFNEAWERCSSLPDPEREPCKGEVRNDYVGALARRYFKADFAWIRQELARDGSLDFEWLATKSHNERLLAEIRANLADINRQERAFGQGMEGIRSGRIQLSADARDREIEAAEEENRQAWAAALRGLGQGLQNAAAASNANSSSPYGRGPSTAYVPSGCSSDFACGLGKKCVKNYYQATGVCMDAVTKYGTPSFSPPDPGSVLPNMPSKKSCTLGACPAGFRCDLQSGVCVR